MLQLMAITCGSFLSEEFASQRGDSCDETTVLMGFVWVIGPLGQIGHVVRKENSTT